MAEYKGWSREDLLTRIAGLEALLGGQNGGLARTTSSGTTAAKGTDSGTDAAHGAQAASGNAKGKQKKQARPFDVAAQPCRKIALRFSYDGAHYSGLAAQGPSSYSSSSSNGVTPLPTVESVLWRALAQARLVDEAKSFEGAGWSRCGRTDRGVSAAGQVVALWVRSRRMDERRLRNREEEIRRRKWGSGNEEEAQGSDEGHGATTGAMTGAEAAAAAMEATRLLEEEMGPRPAPILIDPEAEELPYVASLNRILPPTIRVHAWSPVRSDFSARFDCRYRHYKYFFTAGAPASLRPSSASGSGSALSGGHNLAVGSGPRLDIDAMRDAARRLLGSHDFRNLCKVDSSKQVTNFVRRVDGVSIDIVPHGHWSSDHISPKDDSKAWSSEHMYVFNLRGTAFLYHQVRHIMAILFLVGARLESPQIVDELINVETGRAARDRAAVAALRRDARAKAGTQQSDVLGPEAEKSIQDWIDWCLPGSSATEPDGHTANTRPGGPKSDASIATSTGVDALTNSDMDELPSSLESLTVYETKPMYEMAADRPLVLWECGFRHVDVSWRAGPYDRPLGDLHSLPEPVAPPAPSVPDSIELEEVAVPSAKEANAKPSTAKQPQKSQTQLPEESNTIAAWRTVADLHMSWTTSAISAQINRHLVLAAPSPHVGTLPAWTHFLDAAVPVQPAAVQAESEARKFPSMVEDSNVERPTHAVPIGNGQSRPHGSYVPLAKRKRGETVEVINSRWVAGRGARRAAVRGLTAEELSRGMKPRVPAEERGS
ncbi:pseudouridine synthase deg1 [Tilletia horrida]|uniref:Pseudouridine synthase deg1 n=1 Tax=Tilletia horrida TaxID=155126 RepID=A0AAN6GVG8_9BASI|nr:pseudouridine synthase deg1 [Tilletia horrida]KAK0557715.1 pseudouridine synthase deg1 [Tilletia horrida]KAK0570310.1 pseudouridine synthase deg1 [Tilletia horrida]